MITTLVKRPSLISSRSVLSYKHVLEAVVNVGSDCAKSRGHLNDATSPWNLLHLTSNEDEANKN